MYSMDTFSAIKLGATRQTKSSCSKELQLNVSTGPAKTLTLTPHYSMDTLTKGL